MSVYSIHTITSAQNRLYAWNFVRRLLQIVTFLEQHSS